MLKKNFVNMILLFLILALALVLRLYKINIPLADHHSWRQADTAAVARNFIKEGFDFFHPRIDNMIPLIAGGTFNTQRYFFVEPPLYQSVVAPFYYFFGIKESLARLVSIGFFLGSIILLYLLTSKMINHKVGLLTAFFMAVLPYSIFFTRIVMPEPMMLFACTGMLYFFWQWLEKPTKWGYFLAIFFTTFALLIKTFPLFLLLPMIYLAWQKLRFGFLKEKKIWLLVIIAILPLIAWRLWVARFPEGIPGNLWLFNQNVIRFRPAFFHWIFAERIGKMILGYWGVALLVFGLILRPTKKEGWFFYWWLASFLLYVTVFASGNVTHDYYQIPFIPLAAVFLAKGSSWLLFGEKKNFSKFFSYLLFIVCVGFMLAFSWFEIRGFYNIQGGVDVAGVAVDELAPKDALVLTGDSNDVTLLYNTNRHGWTGGYASSLSNDQTTIEKVIKMGGSFYVTTKFEEQSVFGQYMLKNYPVVKKTDQYFLFSLKPL